MKILVSERNSRSRDKLERILVKAGHEVFTASNGVDAFHLYEENSMDMAFIGWKLSGMSGTELCLRIRDYNLKTGHVSYLVLVSGKSEDHDMVSGLDSGADDFVIRPYSQSVILSRVKVAEKVLETKENRIIKVKPLKDKVTEPVAILNREHVLVHKMTGILEVISNMLSSGVPIPKKVMKWGTSSAMMINWRLHEEKEMFYIDTFIHRAQEIHGKTAQLYSRSSLTPIMKEHEMIRTLLQELQAAAGAYDINDRRTVMNFRNVLLRYLPLIRYHAAREEDVFLPFSQRYLTDEDINRILEDFLRIDDEVGQDNLAKKLEEMEQLEKILKIKEKDI